MKLSSFSKVVEKDLLSIPPQIDSKIAQQYLGGGVSKLKYHGLKVPQYRSYFKSLKELKSLSADEQFKLWGDVWTSSSLYEAKSVALEGVSSIFTPERSKTWAKKLYTWAEDIDNWAHSDSLSSLYAQIHEHHPKLSTPQLQIWNDSQNAWLVRQSMVSLFYYSSLRKKRQPSTSLVKKHVRKHFAHPDAYVQKGLGWTLREFGNIDLTGQEDFIFKNADNLSATAFSYSTEKWAPLKKRQIKTLRKELRMKSSSKAKV